MQTSIQQKTLIQTLDFEIVLQRSFRADQFIAHLQLEILNRQFAFEMDGAFFKVSEID
jgi:hypothetical protein